MQFYNGKDRYDIGTNATSNWDILDNAKEDDLWVHLADYPSCYVICKWDNTIVFETKAKEKKNIIKRVKDAGHICWVRNQNKISNILNDTDTSTYINVIYIKCKYVKKGKNIGQAELTKEPKVLKIQK
jgi:hypothetical protein